MSRNIGIIRYVISKENADITVVLVHAMMERGGVKVNLHSFLTSVVTRSVWLAPQTMKRQLVKQGNYSNMANYLDKTYREIATEIRYFSRVFKVLMYLYRDFSRNP